MLRPKNKKLLKKGSYSLAFTVVILAIAVFLNLLIGELSSSATKIDVSENKLYSIGDETKNVASSLTEDVVFTETGTRDISQDSGNIGMKLGEVMSMRDCVYALFIKSANEVAAQIAEYVGGTEQNFIDMMNQRAAEIGCTNTHFANASGLPDANHYSTARDMALIMREALKNKTFREIIATPTYTIQPSNMNSDARTLHTHHPMFVEESTYL